MDNVILGVDSATPVTLEAARALHAEGVRFWGRYLVPKTWKALTKTEANLIRGTGIALLLIWETAATRARLGEFAGASDGITARELAAEMGVPNGTAIYFAVDYNAPAADYPTVEAYLRAAAKACAPYKVGVYGSYGVIEAMAQRGAADHFWQCVAWSGGRVSARADAYQYQWSGGAEAKALAEKAGFSVDLDRCADMRKAGLWLPMDVDDTPTEPSDFEGHWAEASIRKAIRKGILQGYPDGTIRPSEPVKRGQLAAILDRLGLLD